MQSILNLILFNFAQKLLLSFQSQMIKFFGYPVEEHHVTTQDGYILSLQRIPKGKKGVPPNGGVVFMQHGLVSSSADYVMNLPDTSLGFILADLGYDVWLGNSRGNTYSNKHVNISTDDPKFWAFRFVNLLIHHHNHNNHCHHHHYHHHQHHHHHHQYHHHHHHQHHHHYHHPNNNNHLIIT